LGKNEGRRRAIQAISPPANGMRFSLTGKKGEDKVSGAQAGKKEFPSLWEGEKKKNNITSRREGKRGLFLSWGGSVNANRTGAVKRTLPQGGKSSGGKPAPRSGKKEASPSPRRGKRGKSAGKAAKLNKSGRFHPITSLSIGRGGERHENNTTRRQGRKSAYTGGDEASRRKKTKSLKGRGGKELFWESMAPRGKCVSPKIENDMPKSNTTLP